MSTGKALRAARAAGVRITVDGDDLLLAAPSEPPAAVIDALLEHKAAIVRILRPMTRNWSAQDRRAFFDERAGIAEFEGGLSRAEAEARAFACLVAEWLNHHPLRSLPGRCHGCGAGEHAGDPLLPFGTEDTGHTWLHSRCWSGWYAARIADAVAVFAAIDLTRRVAI